ncbi:MAG: hypothetical protein JKX85_03185, partial [Phycisphaeraceae bacterium]|nr:hypothetical protein [Phycisphaeraceae bacterium]
ISIANNGPKSYGFNYVYFTSKAGWFGTKVQNVRRPTELLVFAESGGGSLVHATSANGEIRLEGRHDGGEVNPTPFVRLNTAGTSNLLYADAHVGRVKVAIVEANPTQYWNSQQ